MGHSLTGLRHPGSVVTIYADTLSTQPYLVHEEFARHHSPVLRAAFDSKFIEGITKTYRLDTTERAVRLLVNWMYTEKLDVQQLGDNPPANDTDAAAHEDFSLVELWVLADKLLIPRLAYVYEHTEAGSPLRKLFVEQCAYERLPSKLEQNPDLFPKEMLLELAPLLYSRSRNASLAPKKRMIEYEVPVQDE